MQEQEYVLDNIITKFRSQKRKSAQSIRDNKKVKGRVKMNGENFEYVSNYFVKFFGSYVTIALLTVLAKFIIKKRRLKIDRLSRRNRSALLCWYAENWDVIHPILKDHRTKEKIKNLVIESRSQENERKNRPFGKQIKLEVDPSDIRSLLNY